METVRHPRIHVGALEDRLYQARIAATAARFHTLAVLPTGLGKTAIAVRVLADYLERYPDRPALVLAPTRPLVVQHGRTLGAFLRDVDPVVLTGTITAERRAELWEPARVIVATPQVVANDLLRRRFPLERLSLIVFDEAHRAVGDYPYVGIGRQNQVAGQARVLALTASPGSQLERIREVWTNLGIERFEYRTVDDPDVRPYVHGIGVETREVPVPPEVQHLAVRLRTAVERQAEVLRKHHLLAPGFLSRRALLDVGARVHRTLEAYRARGEAVPPSEWTVVTAQSAAMKGMHALELIESQGVNALREFLARQAEPERGRLTPAQHAFLQDPDVKEVTARLAELTIEHPKVAAAVEIVRAELARDPNARVIVFSQYRDTVDHLVRELERLGSNGVRPARFVGQAARGEANGLSQRDQAAVLERFRAGEVNCLVATSVAEEGLDIPSTDLVLFYEPIPDVIRTIQRRGRTGRARAGRAVVLVAEGTRDVGLHRSSRSRERQMHEMLEAVEAEARQGSIKPPSAPSVQRSLLEFPN